MLDKFIIEGNYDAAIADLLKTNHKGGDKYFLLGNLYLAKGLYDNALNEYESAEMMGFSSAKMTANRGKCYLAKGMFKEAAFEFDEAAYDLPTPSVLYSLGWALKYMGREDEATSLFRDVVSSGFIDDGPEEDRVNFAFALSEIDRDQGVDLLIRLMNQVSQPSRRIMYWRVAELLDKLERYDEAMIWADIANRSKKVFWDKYNFKREAKKILAAEYNSIGTDDDRPVFIVGVPRSGTSLLDQMLSMHEDVFCMGETEIIWDAIDEYSGKSAQENISGRIKNSKGNIQNIVAGIKKVYDQLPQKKRIVDKMPHNFVWLGFINAIFPSAKIIHVVRDPLDTIVSQYFHEFMSGHDYSYSLMDAGVHWVIHDQMMDFWKAKMDIHEVMYEDLVKKPGETMRGILEYLCLDWDDAVLNFDKSERVNRTISYEQVRQPLYTTSIGRWKNYYEWLKPANIGLDDRGIAE